MKQKDLENAFGIAETCIKPCNKLHKVQENKVSFYLNCSGAEEDKFWCIQVDKCMIDHDLDEKCDYAFYRHKADKTREFYFVELKNTNIQKAYSQIVTTLKKHFKSPSKKECVGFIVASSVPTGANAQNLRKTFMRDYGRDLIIKSNTYTHKPV
jgi:uncharacterized protein (UPF0297 family)